MKPVFLFCLTTTASLFVVPAHTGELDKLSKKIFIEIENELAKIEKGEGADAASSEIEIARKWIGDGKRFLSDGSLEKAAMLAERLPSQLELVRALVAAGSVVSRVEKIEKKIHAISSELATVRARLDRLMLLYHGTDATHAFPSKGEAAK